MSIFDGFIKKEEKQLDNYEEKKEVNIFDIVKKLYALLYNLADRTKLKEEINKITENCTDSDINFLCWLLCHNLCHNKITRQNIDTFVKISYSLIGIDFIYWYFDFMFVNKIRFPVFMPWYKFDKNYNRYREFIEVEYNINDEELNDIEEYFKLSDKDIWEELKYCN